MKHNLYCLENKKYSDNTLYSLFCVKPLLPGTALTIGNSLRRILLNNIVGCAITNLMFLTSFNKNEIENHSNFEFHGVKENFFEFLDCFQKIVLKNTLLLNSEILVNLNGPKIVTASDLLFPKHILLINPNQYLFTITDSITLSFKLFIENGCGFKFSNEYAQDFERINRFILNSNFSPVTKVNYKVNIEKTGNDVFESLFLEIWTNGSITPQRTLRESVKILMTLFSRLF